MVIDTCLGTHQLLLQLLERDCELVLPGAQPLGIDSIEIASLDVTRLSELLDVLASLLQLFSLLGRQLNLARVRISLLRLNVSLEAIVVDTVFDNHLLQSGFLDVFFTELALHIFEKAT